VPTVPVSPVIQLQVLPLVDALALPPSAAVRSARRGRPLALVALVAFLLIAAGVGVGAVLLFRPSSAPDQAVGTPFPSPIALTSPPASHVPSGLADPMTPAYRAGSGFTPDAVRVLTVTVLRLSLEQYKSANGTYPPDLAALFPAFAPKGPDGKPMAGPPAGADGYAYSASGAAYTLAVVLASGQSYTTSNPTEPVP
jgi:hypothetical protein